MQWRSVISSVGTAAAAVPIAAAFLVAPSAVAPSSATGPMGPAVAGADPCPNIDLLFARGTGEPPGIGDLGQVFADNLRDKIGPKTMDVRPVDYPATLDFAQAVQGVVDVNNQVQDIVNTCPKSKIVLAGYSQGAAVIGFVTSPAVPPGIDPADVPAPLTPAVIKHIAAVVVFGMPSPGFMDVIHEPAVVIGPGFTAKTDQLCVDGDPVCAPGGRDIGAHHRYIDDGLVEQGAAFAASRV